MRKIHTGLAACVVVLALVFIEPGPASAAHEGSHHHNHQRTTKRARHKVKAKRKARRRAVSYVCPMHPDIREKSRGACPKCLMDLVAEPAIDKRRRIDAAHDIYL
jgi:hypothetical protein